MKKAMKEAIELLFERDEYLLESKAHERTVAAQLACYLKPHFPEHDVDVEYNRHGLDPKAVDLPPNCRGGGKRLIVPDIVVHRRGHDRENLLVIQVKMETNPQSRDCDIAIIEAMMREYKYRKGLLLDLPAGPGAANRKEKPTWFPE